MVGPRELPNAVALNAGLFNGSRVIGPAVAGVIIAAAGTGICFVLNAASFLAVRTALAFIRSDQLHVVERDPSARIVDGTRRALSFVRHDPELRLVLAVVAIVSTVGFNFHVLVPLLAGETLQVGPEGFGLLSASFGLGALVGALATATFRAATWRLFATGGAGFGVLALALAPVQNALLAGVLLFVAGIAFTLHGECERARPARRRTGCAAVSSASTSSPSPASRRSEGSSRAGSPRSGDDARVRRRRRRRSRPGPRTSCAHERRFFVTGRDCRTARSADGHDRVVDVFRTPTSGSRYCPATRSSRAISTRTGSGCTTSTRDGEPVPLLHGEPSRSCTGS